MLPGIDGFEVISALRQQGELIPTLMLTARSRPEDVLRGFEAGADDYLSKPFELSILIARIRGLLRRSNWVQQQQRSAVPARDVFEFAGRTIDFDNLQLRVGDKSMQLTLMEANLLRFLSNMKSGSLASRHARKDLESSRRYRYPRDRQLHRPAAPAYRTEPAQPRHLQTVAASATASSPGLPSRFTSRRAPRTINDMRTLVLLLTAVASSTSAQTNFASDGTPSQGACAPSGTTYIRTTLYFGLARPAGTITERQWKQFVRDEVTPRFPAGFTVWEADGQWRSTNGRVARERAKVLLLVHSGEQSVRDALGSLVASYKHMFQQESVLWETATVCAAF